MAPSITQSPRPSTARGRWLQILVLIGMAAATGSVFCAAGRSAADPPPQDELQIDRTLPMFLHIEDEQPILSSRENADEAKAYGYLLTLADHASAEAFARLSRTDVHHYHLWAGDRQKYRGEIVRVDGTLRRVWRLDVPGPARNAGVRNLYEAWIFDSRDKYNPWCLVFTELPPEIPLDGPYGQHVAFDGYFFKLYRYKDQKDESRLAPLLIGHTLVLVQAGAEPGHFITTQVLLCFLAVLSITVAAIIILAWRFRRGDDRVRQRLEAARPAGWVDPPPE
jgi:hypothetical protein